MTIRENFTVRALRSALRKGDVSSRELTRDVLERIDRLEPRLHAFITLTPDLALRMADEADRRWQAWRKDPEAELPNAEPPALLGLPMAIKDVLTVAGVRCTCGSKILENYIPPFTATAVQRLARDTGNALVPQPTLGDFAALPGDRDRWVFTRDSINKSYTSAAVVISGRKPGDPRSRATLWVLPGEPITAVALPLWVEAGRSPEPFWKGDEAPLWVETLRVRRSRAPSRRPSARSTSTRAGSTTGTARASCRGCCPRRTRCSLARPRS